MKFPSQGLFKIKQLMAASRLGLGVIRCRLTGERRPLVCSFHITNKCNLRCPYCYANKDDRFDHPPEDMGTEEVKGYIDELCLLGTRWLIVLGGEPLMRDDIEEILKYARSKNLLIELVTNGHLVPERLEAIKHIDFLCISVEGDEETHDKARNRKGSYQKVLEAVEAVRDAKIPVKIRFHATLSQKNYQSLEHFQELTEKYPGTEFGFSQIIVHDYNDIPDASFTNEELRGFWLKLKKLKESGANCYNSDFIMDYICNWPLDYRRLPVSPDEFAGKKFKYIPCKFGKQYVYVDSEGYLYACIVTGIHNGPNIREIGVREAWKQLKSPECITCSYIQYVENNSMLNFRAASLLKGIKYIFSKRR